jgi:hypothetical protein
MTEDGRQRTDDESQMTDFSTAVAKKTVGLIEKETSALRSL